MGSVALRRSDKIWLAPQRGSGGEIEEFVDKSHLCDPWFDQDAMAAADHAHDLEALDRRKRSSSTGSPMWSCARPGSRRDESPHWGLAWHLTNSVDFSSTLRLLEKGIRPARFVAAPNMNVSFWNGVGKALMIPNVDRLRKMTAVSEYQGGCVFHSLLQKDTSPTGDCLKMAFQKLCVMFCIMT